MVTCTCRLVCGSAEALSAAHSLSWVVSQYVHVRGVAPASQPGLHGINQAVEASSCRQKHKAVETGQLLPGLQEEPCNYASIPTSWHCSCRLGEGLGCAARQRQWDEKVLLDLDGAGSVPHSWAKVLTCYAVHVGYMCNLKWRPISECWYGDIAYAIYEHEDHLVRYRCLFWCTHASAGCGLASVPLYASLHIQ